MATIPAPVDGWMVECDQHAEPDRHRRRAERQHQADVEHPAVPTRRRDREGCESAEHHRDHRRDDGGAQRRHQRADRVAADGETRSKLGRAERPPGAQRPSFPGTQRSQREHDEWSQHGCRGREGAERDQRALPRGDRSSAAGTAQPEARRRPPLRAGRPRDEQCQHDQLHHREHCGTADVAELRRPPRDLHLDRRVARATEHLHDAERGEGEQEHDGGGRDERRTQQRQRHLAERPEPARTQRARRAAEVARQLGPERADDAHDDGDVAEHVGDEDRCRRPRESIRQQRQEGGTDDDRWQQERHRRDRGEQPPAGERPAGEQPRRPETGDEGEHGAGRRLPAREPEDLDDAGAVQRVDDHPGAQHAAQERDQRPRVEQQQERQRGDDQREAKPPRQRRRASRVRSCAVRRVHRSTISVQASTHSSRCAAMSAGATVSG